MPAKRSRLALGEDIDDLEQPAKKKGKQANYYGMQDVSSTLVLFWTNL